MLSLGAATIHVETEGMETWAANLRALEGAQTHPETMEWWLEHPEAYQIATAGPRPAEEVMLEFAEWVERIPGKVIAAAWPASYDFAFVNYYLWRFVGRNPLGFACLDMRSLAMGLSHSPGYYDLDEAQIKSWVRALGSENPPRELKAHLAVDDAISQAMLLRAMLVKAQG
jgi:hypothetical protein